MDKCPQCFARDCDCPCETCTAAREQRARDDESPGTTLGKNLAAAFAAKK